MSSAQCPVPHLDPDEGSPVPRHLLRVGEQLVRAAAAGHLDLEPGANGVNVDDLGEIDHALEGALHPQRKREDDKEVRVERQGEARQGETGFGVGSIG